MIAINIIALSNAKVLIRTYQPYCVPVPGRLHAPTHLWFYVSALKAVFLSSFSGIKTFLFSKNRLLVRSFTRDQRLSFSKRLTTHRTHRTRATQQPYSAQPGVVRGFRLGTLKHFVVVDIRKEKKKKKEKVYAGRRVEGA